MTQHPSPDRLLRRLPDITGLDPTYTPTTDAEADGTVLDVIPLPGTDKVLMIVAHVVPARTVKTTEPMPDPQHAEPRGAGRSEIEPGGTGPGGAGQGKAAHPPPATSDPADPRSNATTRNAMAAATPTAVRSPESARTPLASEPRPEAPERLGTATPKPPRAPDARQPDRPEQPRVPDARQPGRPQAPRTATPEPRAAASYATNSLHASPSGWREPGEPEPQEPGEPRSETIAAGAGYPTAAQTPTGPPSDGLRVDRPSRRVLVDDREVQLTFQEFELLAHFAAHPWTVFTRAELMRALWPATDPTTRTVDIHVHRLRRKLGRLSTQLTTVRRVGYVYRPHLTNRAATPPPSG
jgi:hypothetical protein